MPPELYQLQILCITSSDTASTPGQTGCGEIAIVPVRRKILARQLTGCIDLVRNPAFPETDGGALRLSIPQTAPTPAEAEAQADNSYHLQSRLYMPKINCFD